MPNACNLWLDAELGSHRQWSQAAGLPPESVQGTRQLRQFGATQSTNSSVTIGVQPLHGTDHHRWADAQFIGQLPQHIVQSTQRAQMLPRG